MQRGGNRFAEVMAQRTDADLLEIATTARDDYQDEALEAAEAELSRRDLTPEIVEAAEQQLEEKRQESANRASEPLSAHWKALTFVFPGVANLFIALAVKSEGYERKYREAWRWTLYGVAAYAALGLVAVC